MIWGSTDVLSPYTQGIVDISMQYMYIGISDDVIQGNAVDKYGRYVWVLALEALCASYGYMLWVFVKMTVL